MLTHMKLSDPEHKYRQSCGEEEQRFDARFANGKPGPEHCRGKHVSGVDKANNLRYSLEDLSPTNTASP